MKKIKCCVTGNAGFIGSHLADELLSQGYDVIGIDNLSLGSIENVSKDVEFLEWDLATIEMEKLKEKLSDIDYVFHLAALPRIMMTIKEPLLAHKDNVNATIRLLDACRGNKIKKLILSSTACVYGKPLQLPVTEEESIKVDTTYGVQKYMQEMYVKLYSGIYGVPSIILRYFNVYGSKRQSEKGSYPNVLAAFSKAKKETGKVYVTGDGEQTRDFVHVIDVAKANMLAATSEFVNSEVFNIGTGVSTTINKIAEYFDCPIERIQARPMEIKHVVCDNKKAEKLLNWHPQISVEEGVKNYMYL